MSIELSATALFNVKGIVAVITGGGSGSIGLMMTKALAANGAHRIYIVGRREDVLRDAANSIDPNVVIPLSGDITSQDSLLGIAARIESEIGYVNLVIANAGIMGPRPLKAAPGNPLPTISEYRAHALQSPMQDFTQTYAVNVTGVYYTALAFLTLLDAGNTKGNFCTGVRSQIIAVSSIGGFSRLSGASFAYNSSKAAVTHMMKMLATSLAPYRIRCNVLAPGIFPSDMTTGIIGGLNPLQSETLDKNVIPAERTGCEQDIAGAVLWMAGLAGAYLNGSVVVVDGGRLGMLTLNSNDLVNSPGFLGAVARFWQRSYASDYVGIALLLCGYIPIQFLGEPFHRMFFLDNLAIGYPHAEIERVSVGWLLIFAGAVPLGLLVAWALLFRPGSHKAHVTILGLIISLILTSFITDVIKNAVGRPRPDLIARCKPAPGTPAHQLVTYKVCTETDHHILHDGWRSFPSGHSSFAFSGLGYLSLFLAGQCHVYRPRADLARVLFALAPLLGAALIAISRCEDYRHDVYDVTVGSLLGLAIAHYTYRRYYPALRNRLCATPFPNPADDKGWGKVKGDEESARGVQEFELSEFEEEEAESEARLLNGGRR
ncbi:hypothetical protein PSV08DRAFT_220835 [Bipolaris maydis]|uniref:uncharacterized protein n=1 Tax=Cochliobolus heterostrophus TaxID=5016 RepID=UPI0024D3ED01|nr:hypothetical protein J3E73DRAFT_239973 [Bipolaris maydis]KAJ6272139.1 hypothetical protein PSV08DRAFT_220835 [Bipolaris maydis]KAJ6281769.1 hypothetical protein J3E71DRAFT_217712 [Bipolaris maydis]